MDARRARELAARLRALPSGSGSWLHLVAVFDKDRDEVAELLDDGARLADELTRLRADRDHMAAKYREAMDEVTRLLAEVARLRGDVWMSKQQMTTNDMRVLRNISAACDEYDGYCPHGQADWTAIKRLCRRGFAESAGLGECQSCKDPHYSAVYVLTDDGVCALAEVAPLRGEG